MSKKVQLDLGQFDAVIFDMDGTMIDNALYHKKAWKEFAKKHGLNLTDEDYRNKFSGRKNDFIVPSFIKKPLTKEEIHSIAEEKEAVYRRLYSPFITEIAGLKDLINFLKDNGKIISVATTAPKSNRDFGFKALQLENTFLVVMGDEHVEKGKPDPEIYLKTMKKINVKPSRCIIFEDSPPGVEAAKKSGAIVIGILSSHSDSELFRADFTINDYTQIEFV